MSPFFPILIVGLSSHRLKQKEEVILGDLQRDIQTERDRCKSLETKVCAVLKWILSACV